MKNIASKQFRSVMFTLFMMELANAVACMVDGFTVSHFLGNDAMAAFGIASPFFSLAAIVSGILMVSCQVLTSKSLGKGNTKEADSIFNSLFTVGLIFSIVFTVLGVAFAGQIAALFGAAGDSAYLHPMVKTILVGYFAGIGFNIMFVMCGPVLQLDGRQKLVNLGGLAVAAVDILLDFLNVFVFKLGVLGMALATSASFVVAFAIIFTYFFSKNRTFNINFKSADIRHAFSYLTEGLPRGIGMLARLVGPICTNIIILAAAGTVGMAAFSVLNSVKFLLNAPGWGISGAVLMMGGIAIGEKDRKELAGILKQSVAYVGIVLVTLAVLLEALASPIAGLFIADSEETRIMTEHILRWFGLALPFVALNNIACCYLQAIGSKVGTYLYNIGNEFVAYVAVLLVMGKLFGTEGLWASLFVEQVLLLIIYAIAAFTRRSDIKGIGRLLLLDSKFDASREDLVEYRITEKSQVCMMSEKVIALCKTHNVDDTRAYHLGLCLEELADNAIVHGFKADTKKHTIEVKVLIDEDSIVLRMRDDCKPFDLRQYVDNLIPKPDEPEKNMGIRLVVGTAKEINYSYTLGINCILLKI